MKTRWRNIAELFKYMRRSGSTTWAVNAAKQNECLVIFVNEEQARQHKGVSVDRIDDRFISGRKPIPLMLDNGVVLQMIEEIGFLEGDVAAGYERIQEIERKMKEAERSHVEAILSAHRRGVERTQFALYGAERRFQNGIKYGRLMSIPALTKRVPIGEIRYYMRYGFPNY